MQLHGLFFVVGDGIAGSEMAAVITGESLGSAYKKEGEAWCLTTGFQPILPLILSR